MRRHPDPSGTQDHRQKAALLAAALGCLQPGIDPVFLSLLSRAGSLPASWHGWLVGATQSGMAIGALVAWRFAERTDRAVLAASAFAAFLCALATALLADPSSIVAVRAVFGLATGIVYAQAMAACATRRPIGAYGGVLLLQLTLSTGASLLLPAIAATHGERAALLALTLAPLAMAAATLAMPYPIHPRHRPEGHVTRSFAPVPVQGWYLAAATFWFICATMTVWSFSGALALDAGLSEQSIGRAVAAGSVAGALTAIATMREGPRIPLPLAAALSGLLLLAPPLLTAPEADTAFLVAIVALNIGSTAMIVRCSGEASAASDNARFRTFVAATHALGMICGPLLGSGLVSVFGSRGLMGGASAAILAAIVAACAASLSRKLRPAVSPKA